MPEVHQSEAPDFEAKLCLTCTNQRIIQLSALLEIRTRRTNIQIERTAKDTDVEVLGAKVLDKATKILFQQA